MHSLSSVANSGLEIEHFSSHFLCGFFLLCLHLFPSSHSCDCYFSSHRQASQCDAYLSFLACLSIYLSSCHCPFVFVYHNFFFVYQSTGSRCFLFYLAATEMSLKCFVDIFSKKLYLCFN